MEAGAGAKLSLEEPEPERTDSESEVRGGAGGGPAGRAAVRDSRRQPTLSPAWPSPQEEPTAAAAAGRGDFAAGFAFSEKEAAAGPGGGAWAEALGQLKRKVGARDAGRERERGRPQRPSHLSAPFPSHPRSAAPPAWTRRSRRCGGSAELRSEAARSASLAALPFLGGEEEAARWARGFGPGG